MKINLYFLTVFCFFVTTVFSQNKCFTIYDSSSSTAIAYANIWKNEKIYANSDVKGKFYIKDIDMNSEFKISCIGYLTKLVDLNANTIYLEKEKVNLDEVVIINPKKKQSIKLGKTNETDILVTATMDLNKSEIGKSFVLNKKEQFYLKEVKFKTSTYQAGRTMGLKIYSLNENNEPDQIISSENIILSLEKGTHVTTYNFEKNLIPVSRNGFFVSLQILLIDENKQFGTSGNLTDRFFYDPAIGAALGVEEEFCYTQQEEGVWIKMKNIDLNIKVELTD